MNTGCNRSDMDMINRLVNLISREASLFENFLELLNRQKETLVQNDLKALKEVTEKQREKMVESQLLNKERESLIEEIRAANLVDGDVTVSRLLEFADQNQAGRLTQLRETILDLNDRITEARNTNAMLLNQSREFIAKTMAMLSKINNPEHSYSRDGAGGRHRANVAVDRRA